MKIDIEEMNNGIALMIILLLTLHQKKGPVYFHNFVVEIKEIETQELLTTVNGTQLSGLVTTIQELSHLFCPKTTPKKTNEFGSKIV